MLLQNNWMVSAESPKKTNNPKMKLSILIQSYLILKKKKKSPSWCKYLDFIKYFMYTYLVWNPVVFKVSVCLTVILRLQM